MKATIMQKVDTRKTDYGEKVGGFEGATTPVGAVRIDHLENVSSVIVDSSGTEPEYVVTHMTGEDEEAHTTRYSSEHYNIMVTGG